MDEQKLKTIIEGALLAAGRPLSIDDLLGLFPEDERPERDEMRAALGVLSDDYEGRGIEVKEVASGFRVQVREGLSPWISRLWVERPSKYSRAFLETLALIAYRQPITRGEIEDIRGVSVSSSIMKTLQERDWIRVVGHRDVPGKPAMYGTTRGFLDYFNLKSLDELPTLAELRDIDSINAELDLGDVPPSGNAETEEDDDGVQASAAVAGDDPELMGEVADDEVRDEIADAAESEIDLAVEEDSEPTAASEQDAVADDQDDDDDDEDSDAGERLSENG
jgi:segregation and condensation protein B